MLYHSNIDAQVEITINPFMYTKVQQKLWTKKQAAQNDGRPYCVDWICSS